LLKTNPLLSKVLMNLSKSTSYGVCVLIFVTTNSGAAQNTSGTTYREITNSRSVIATPNGSVSLGSTHDATIRVSRITSDSAVAVYEKLEITSTTPAGERNPDVSSALHQEFILKFDDRGHVQTLATPTFPASLKGITDLRYQFFDFFAPIAKAGIRTGLEWSDTLILRENAPSAAQGETRKITILRVVGDTTIDGIPGWLMKGSGVVDTKSAGPVEGQPGISVEVVMQGPETNVFVVSKADLSLILRLRSAELKGAMKYVGAPQPLQFEMTRSYTNEIRRVNRPK
jgi:hypothetical protein